MRVLGKSQIQRLLQSTTSRNVADAAKSWLAELEEPMSIDLHTLLSRYGNVTVNCHGDAKFRLANNQLFISAQIDFESQVALITEVKEKRTSSSNLRKEAQ